MSRGGSSGATLAVLLVFAAAGCAGCERGCVSTWLASKGATGGGPPSGSAFLPLHAVDCPDGLARCVDGVVEVSRVYSYASPCAGPPEKCRCPWDQLGACDRGCTAEGVEIILGRERASAQLCVPPATSVFSRPPLTPTTGAVGTLGASAVDGATLPVSRALCEGELYRCVSASVVACAVDGGEPAAIATCIRGCAEEASYLDDERITREQAVPLLCRH